MTWVDKAKSRWIPEPNTGCWLWDGSVQANGYGRINTGARTIGAHRAAWTAWFGPVPAGLDVCHRCDVRCCVNPDHLFVGSRAVNLADMRAKGRHANPPRLRGAANRSAKLTSAQVFEIKRALAAGQTCAALARAYGVSVSSISLIRRGEHWAHV